MTQTRQGNLASGLETGLFKILLLLLLFSPWAFEINGAWSLMVVGFALLILLCLPYLGDIVTILQISCITRTLIQSNYCWRWRGGGLFVALRFQVPIPSSVDTLPAFNLLGWHFCKCIEIITHLESPKCNEKEITP